MCGLSTRPQDIDGSPEPQKDQLARIQPEFDQAGAVNLALLPAGGILPEPEDRFCSRRAPGERRCKPCAGRRIRRTSGDLVQGAAFQPPTEGGIDDAIIQREKGFLARRLATQGGDPRAKRLRRERQFRLLGMTH